MPDGSRFFFGLDLGQTQDYSALAIIERSPATGNSFPVRHLQRWPLGTPYPHIITGMQDRLASLSGHSLYLAVDGTGVGRAVVDLFKQAVAALTKSRSLGCTLWPVTITGGSAEVYGDGYYSVPKRDLVGLVQVMLQTNRLKVATQLPEAATLVRELENFQVKITDAANDTYGCWREGTHDDLVLALAMALWAANRPMPVQPFVYWPPGGLGDGWGKPLPRRPDRFRRF